MASERPPAFRFYAKDWRDVKVRRMSLAAQGAYIDILADMWVDSKDQCSILNCDPFIAKSLGVSVKIWRKLREEIQHKTEPLLVDSGGRLISKRLKVEAIKQRKYAEEQRIKGLKGAEKRWRNDDSRGHSTGTAEGVAKNSSSLSSSSSSSSLKSKTKILVSPPKGDKSGDNSDMRSGEGMTPLSDTLKAILGKHLELPAEKALGNG